MNTVALREIFDTTLDEQKTLNSFYLREIGQPSNYSNTPHLNEYFLIKKLKIGGMIMNLPDWVHGTSQKTLKNF